LAQSISEFLVLDADFNQRAECTKSRIDYIMSEIFPHPNIFYKLHTLLRTEFNKYSHVDHGHQPDKGLEQQVVERLKNYVAGNI
jgi:hypothetical protein